MVKTLIVWHQIHLTSYIMFFILLYQSFVPTLKWSLNIKGDSYMTSRFFCLAAENVWVEVTSMNDSRFGCAVVAHQGKIYVSGGFGSDKNILSSSEVYDPGIDSIAHLKILLYWKCFDWESNLKTNWKKLKNVLYCSVTKLLYKLWFLNFQLQYAQGHQIDALFPVFFPLFLARKSIGWITRVP